MRSRGGRAQRVLGLCLLAVVGLATGCGHPADKRPDAPVARQAPGGAPRKTGSATPATTPSPFAIRGVIEGYYGFSWSTTATQDVLAFMGKAGMNTFVYAPKFDPYARADWRQPYPPAQLAELAGWVRAAKRDGVTFVYSLSPGLSITYSSAADRAALEAKLNQLRGIGIDAFMLSFDDISAKLAPADQAAYHGNLGTAQVSLTNAIWTAERQADPSFSLMFTPTIYDGTQSSPYLRQVAGLDSHIQVAWTGPQVVPVQITLAQAQAYGAIIGRKPLLWLNYPVNDWTIPKGQLGTRSAQPRVLFLGPMQGLDPELAQGVTGVLANPMLEPYASMIPLASVAAYLQDPASPAAQEAAWQHEITLLGGRAASALRMLVQGEEPYPADSPLGYYTRTSTDATADQLETAVLAAYSQSGRSAVQGTAGAELRQLFAGWVLAAPQLAAGMASPGLAEDIAPWASAMGEDGQAGLNALQLLANPQDSAARAVVEAAIGRLGTAQVAFGGDLRQFLEGVAAAG